jgi:STE24 endopeptidase
MKSSLLILLFCFCFIGISFAAADSIATVQKKDIVIKKFDYEAATQTYMNSIPQNDKANSDAYFEGGYWLILWNLIYDIVVVAIFYFAGIAAWLKKLVTKISKNNNIQNLLYVAIYSVITYILSFPLGVYTGYFREHEYNLSNLNFGQWFGEEMISLGLAVVFGSMAIMVFYIFIRRTGQNWWKWCTGMALIFLIIGALVAPVFISPLFNKYKPLADAKVKEGILSMARANNVPATNVYEFDASKQSDRISANVSGFAGTTRVSLNDNLLKKCSPEEIQAVMGHELGHYVLNHIYKMISMFLIMIFIGFGFVNWALNKALASGKFKTLIVDLKDIAGYPLLTLIFSIFMFFTTPVFNTIIRTQEIEADMFGLNTARQPDAFAKVAIKLSTYRKMNPGYWEEIFFFDHPSGHNRILEAMRWKAEHLNECEEKQ